MIGEDLVIERRLHGLPTVVKMREIEQLGVKIDNLLAEIERQYTVDTRQQQAPVYGQPIGDMALSLPGTYDPRWLSIARTQLQIGMMAMIRAVEQPRGF